MHVITRYEGQADELLASEAGAGDRDAFAALYQRYIDGLYDFALRMVRDPDQAADVVQNTFTKAWESLQRRTMPGNVKAWLFTIARNSAIDEIRHRKRMAGLDDRSLPSLSELEVSPLPDPETAYRNRELAALVWESAAALSAEEYSLLDLHVRRGLEADELAANLHLRKGAVYTRLSRLRDALEESVTSTLLARLGRRDCSDLDALLGRFPAAGVTREIRRAVQGHLRDCRRCQESKRRYLSPAELFSGLVVIPPAQHVRESIWQRVSAHMDAVGSGPRGRRRGRARRWWTRTSALMKMMLLTAAAVALLATGVGVFALAAAAARPGPEDPVDVHSTSHEIGRPSTNNRVILVWSFQPKAAAYSILWSQRPVDHPNQTPNVPGSATGVMSPPLTLGEQYAHISTQGRNGQWTSTVHIGPFIIEAVPTAAPSPTPTASPSPTPTPSPTPLPTPTPSPSPTQAPSPSPTPTPTPSPSQTPPPHPPPSPSPSSS